jgi:hypothetical protein
MVVEIAVVQAAAISARQGDLGIEEYVEPSIPVTKQSCRQLAQ